LVTSNIVIPWAKPAIDKEERRAALKVIDSGWMTQGKVTESLEKEICKKMKCKHAVVTSNGTTALICALIANGIGPGDEVIVPSFTFIASVNSIISVGAKPVLVDSDPHTFNTTPELVRKKITSKTKAIMPVDVAGMPVDIDAFQDLAKTKKIILLEDAAEAMGASYKNKKIGSFGHTAVFSFHIAKIAAGIEGGVVVTNDKKIADLIKLIRSHGDTGGYNSVQFGLNFRTSDIHSAIALEQMKKIGNFVSHRMKLASVYKDELKDFKFQIIPDYVSCHPYMLFAILVDPHIRNKVNEFLNKNGVETRICWRPVHKQKCHANKFETTGFSGADAIYSRIINLPMGNGLSEKEVMKVSILMKKAVQKYQ